MKVFPAFLWRFFLPAMVFPFLIACGSSRKDKNRLNAKTAVVRTLPKVRLSERRHLDSIYRHAIYGISSSRPKDLRAHGVIKYKEITLPVIQTARRGLFFRIEAIAGIRREIIRIGNQGVEVPSGLNDEQQKYLSVFTYSILFPLWEYALEHEELYFDGEKKVNGMPSQCYVWKTGNRDFRFYLGNKHHYPVRMETLVDGKPAYSVDYMDFRPAGPGWMVPRQYIITNKENRETYRVFWHSIRIR